MSALAAVARLSGQLRGSRLVLVCAGMLLAMTVVALLGPVLSPHSYLATDLDRRLLAPTLDPKPLLPFPPQNLHIEETDREDRLIHR